VSAPVATRGETLPTSTGARMDWDAVNGRLVIFAGSDVFALDADGNGTSARVTRLLPAGPAPPARADAGFVVAGDLALVFGGTTPEGCTLDDSWYLVHESQWSLQARATACP
jgi:hypothetical protein